MLRWTRRKNSREDPSGENMDQLIANYSEEGTEGSDLPPGKLTVNSSAYLQFPYFKDLLILPLKEKQGFGNSGHRYGHFCCENRQPHRVG